MYKSIKKRDGRTAKFDRKKLKKQLKRRGWKLVNLMPLKQLN